MDNMKYPLERLICACCLNTKRSLMKLDKCQHGLFLLKILKNMVNYADMYVCSICHEFIIKIYNFTCQVEKSIHILNNKYEELRSKQLHNLGMSAIEINYTVDNEVLKHEFVHMSRNIDVKYDIKTEEYNTSQSEDDVSEDTSVCSIEIPRIEGKDVETSDTEDNIRIKKNVIKNDGSLSVFKHHSYNDINTNTQSQKIKNKFEDNIRIVTLNKDEIIGERKRDSLYEFYLKKTYKCENCIIGFAHQHIYELHNKQKHEMKNGGLICEVCKCVLNNEKALKNHMKEHVVRYECKECGVRKRDRNTAINHYQKHHEDIPMRFICEQCGFTTDLYKSYRSHSNSHRDRVPCQICGGSFANQNVLTKHIFKMHGSPDPVSCPTCDKTFKTDIQLKRHAYLHETPEPTADKFCVTCKRYFRSRTLLKLHLKNHSKHLKDAGKRFTCYECGVKYAEKARLKDHVDWEHLKKRNYVCVHCSKEFETKRCLTRHTMYVHDKIKRPKNKICDLCGTGFSNLRLLQSHIRTHTGERPFKCEICEKTFGFRASLYTHNRLVHKKIKRNIYPKKND